MNIRLIRKIVPFQNYETQRKIQVSSNPIQHNDRSRTQILEIRSLSLKLRIRLGNFCLRNLMENTKAFDNLAKNISDSSLSEKRNYHCYKLS